MYFSVTDITIKVTDPETPLNNAQHSGLFNTMKPFLSFDDQLSLLKSRHLIVKNTEEAKKILKTKNYYRLSGYFKLFTKTGSDEFVESFSMKKLMKIYNFDAELRFLTNEYVSKVEIGSRTRIAYLLAKNTSPDSYLNPAYFDNAHHHTTFIDKVDEEKRKSSRNPIVVYHNGHTMPIWALVEILTFGVVSKMYANLKRNLRRLIAGSNDYEKSYLEQIYSNNLQMVCNLRNICAHHGRLYGKTFPYNLMLSHTDALVFGEYGVPTPTTSTSSPFHLFYALCNLLDSEKDVASFVKRIKRLFFRYRSIVDINMLGFPKKWAKLLK